MIKKETSEIGSFLRRLRFDNNESQDEMAARLGVTAPYISLLEFRQPLTKKIAIKIIKVYGLSGKTKDTFVDMVTKDVVRRFWGK
jgi:transcriptional regulator with XRE-family HTH domain